MKGIPNTERQRLGALLDHETQETVMAMIPQFSETEIGAPVPAPAEVPEELGLLVFNMERGVHLEELGDFLQDCPGVRPLDVVLANELDDGCVRSGGRNTARELAEREIYQNATGEYPVLLLDDVLSELDPRRQEFVLNRIAGGQVFITCCEDDRLPVLLGGKVFHVKQGAIG